jgi:polar amino acid transport system substrate-binding protein
MRISKRIAFLASAAALAFSVGAAGAQELNLKIGTEGAYPPFNNLTADGKLEGFDVDIANALCEEMKAKCEFVTQDWDGIIPALQAGKFDAIIASMSITAERAEKVDFTNKYYNTPPAIVAPKDSDIKGVAKEDLAGKTIGVASSTTHFNYSTATYTDSDIKSYPSSQEFLLDLANGRLDAVNDDISVLEEWLKTPDGACCKLVGAITPVPEIHGPGAGIAVRKGETDLVNKFNAAIDAIRANGKYKEINDKYFTFDVFGGANS